MNSVRYFAEMDILSMKPYRRYLILLVLPLFGIGQTPALAVQLLTFLSLTSFSSYLFASEDKNDMRRLYGILPVSVKDIVLGRYLACISGVVAYCLAMTALLCACAAFTGLPIYSVIYTMIVCTGLIFVSVAVQFPIFFKVGFIKGKGAAVAPSFVLLAVILLFRQAWQLDFLSASLLYEPLGSLGVLSAGIVALVLSVFLSVWFYRGREE